MEDNNLYDILDLIEEIRNVDKMIDIHSDSKSDLMLSQYINQKLKLTNILIKDLLINGRNNPEVMYLIKLMIDKFYGNVIKNHESIDSDNNLKKIKEAFSI